MHDLHSTAQWLKHYLAEIVISVSIALIGSTYRYLTKRYYETRPDLLREKHLKSTNRKGKRKLKVASRVLKKLRRARRYYRDLRLFIAGWSLVLFLFIFGMTQLVIALLSQIRFLSAFATVAALWAIAIGYLRLDEMLEAATYDWFFEESRSRLELLIQGFYASKEEMDQEWADVWEELKPENRE